MALYSSTKNSRSWFIAFRSLYEDPELIIILHNMHIFGKFSLNAVKEIWRCLVHNDLFNPYVILISLIVFGGDLTTPIFCNNPL